MKSNVDYVWIIVVAIVVVLAFSWKSLTGMFGNVSDKVSNKESYDKGKAIFYDTEFFGGEGSYKSCAMCHAKDFVPEPGKKIEMMDYKEGDPHILEGMKNKYRAGMLDTGDELYKRITICISSPTKMALGKVSRNAPYMDDLMEYVRQQ